MPDQLFSHRLEFRAIRGMSGPKRAVGARLFAGLDEECFVDPGAGRVFYNRIRILLHKHGTMPMWDELMDDSVIPERYRDEYEDRVHDDGKWVLEDIEHAIRMSEQLVNYRIGRQMAELTVKIQDHLRGDELNGTDILDMVGEKLTEARGNLNAEQDFIHMGDKSNYKPLLLNLLEGKGIQYIPSGIAAFDRKNRGIPRGTLMGVGATTGGGKSTLTRQMTVAQAQAGYRSMQVTLEMNQDENMQRDVSDIGNTSMNDLLDPRHRLTDQDRKRILNAMDDMDEAMYQAEGLRTTWAPRDDVSMEEILYLLQPMRYDCIVIDYMGLLKGMGNDKQWLNLGEAARLGMRFGAANQCAVVIVMQVDEEGMVRYAKSMREHCFAGSETFLTKEHGLVSFRAVANQNVTVLTEVGWRSARIRSFGEQPTQKVVLQPVYQSYKYGHPFWTQGKSKYTREVIVTPEHRWILQDNTVTQNLATGDIVRSVAAKPRKKSVAYRDGLRHGVIFGDGAIHRQNVDGKYHYLLQLIAKKRRFKYLFDRPRKGSHVKGTKVDCSSYTNYKEVPAGVSPDYYAGFIDGWVGTDGYAQKGSKRVTLGSQNAAALDWLEDHAPFAGYVVTGRSPNGTTHTNYGKRSAPLETMQLARPSDIAWKVKSIRKSKDREVFCANVPGEEAFTLAGGVYTGNCKILWTWVNDDRAKETGIVEVRQQKSRNAEGFTFYLKKDFEHNRFLDVDEKSASMMRSAKSAKKKDDQPAYKPATTDGNKRVFTL